MRERPVIAIPMGVSCEGWDCGVLGRSSLHYLNPRYVSRIWEAGGLPWPLAMQEDQEYLHDLLATCDGVLLAGGPDLDPALWGETNTHCRLVSPLRDRIEVWLARRCHAQGVPLLGVCRGMQVMAVALGGSLWQDVALGGYGAHKLPDDLPGDLLHGVAVSPGSLLRRVMGGCAGGTVNSHHHQAVRRTPPGLVVTARAVEDQAVEALEASDGHPFFLGVQWHPERSGQSRDDGVFAAFIAAAAQRSRCRRLTGAMS